MIGWLWCRRRFAALCVLGSLLGSARAHAQRPEPRVLGCPTSCRLLLEPGLYRLTVEPSRTRRGGQRLLDVVEPGIYRIDGVPRSQRTLGLALASLGIPLAFGGFGAMLGSADVDERMTPRQRGWFWSGAVAFGVGATLVPAGFRLYAAFPDVAPEGATAAGSPAAAPDQSVSVFLPGKPYRSETPMPSGYTLVEEPRWGLVTSGALTLAGAYGLFVAGGAAVLASDTWEDDDAAYLLVPVVGPALYDLQQSPREQRGLMTFWGSVPQVTGLVLLIVGASTSHSWLVPDTRAQIVPWFTPGASGLALQGELF